MIIFYPYIYLIPVTDITGMKIFQGSSLVLQVKVLKTFFAILTSNRRAEPTGAYLALIGALGAIGILSQNCLWKAGVMRKNDTISPETRFS